MAKKNTPEYSLSFIQSLIKKNKIDVWISARRSSYKDFLYKDSYIKRALLSLDKTADFYKTMPHETNSNIKIDVYKAKDLLGKKVYTKFYLEPNEITVQLQSFKKL